MTGVAAIWLGDQLGSGSTVSIIIVGEQVQLPDGAQAFQFVSPFVWMISYAGWFVWQYRVHNNALAVAPSSVATRPAWGVLSWFVLFLNLVTPFRVVREIQRASMQDDQPYARVVVWLWWSSWVGVFLAFTTTGASLMFDLFAALERAVGSPPPLLTVELSRFTIGALFATQVLLCPCAALAVLVVWGITRGQRGTAWFPTEPDAASPSSSSAPPRPDLG